MDIALITHIESDSNCLNQQLNTIDPDEHRYYEQEAIYCFTCWRKNAGWLKDIPIYCLCATPNVISDSTKQRLSALGVNYIEHAADVSKFSSGFLTIPYTGYYFETVQPLAEDILLKIDLDNYVQKPISKHLVEAATNAAVIGQYSNQLDDRTTYDGEMPFDTSLIITKRANQFYKLYYDLCFDKAVQSEVQWQKTHEQSGDYWLEEFVIDYIYHYKLFNIFPVQNYQYGLHYPSLEWFVKNHLTQNLFMQHQHLSSRRSI